MEADASTPLFTVGQEIAAFLASWEILSKTWEESQLASNSESFNLKEHEGVAYVTFPSFHKIEDFNIKGSKYGEANIQTNKVFSDCLKGYDDQPAQVHQGALKLFLRIMEETDFKTKLQIYTDSKQRKLKPIIFVGHSLGGAVATLATLWVLEKRVRQSSPFCITFGCPLVGDERLVEAVGRENWGGKFLHVVSQHDIVPRMFLAPLESIAKPLTDILPYWQGKVPYASVQDVYRTLQKTVLQYTYTIANYGHDSLRGSDGVIERSPYKPFGTYMFCSSYGAACIDNSETVLKMLHWTMQSHEKASDNIVQDCFSEHIGYGSVLKHVIEKSVSGIRFTNTDSKSSYEIGISMQLIAIGVGAQNDHAELALRRAVETENKNNTNADELAIQLSLRQSIMAELEWYKELCEKNGGIGYYDTFKNQDMKDIHANQHRMTLGGFWDDIIEQWENHELPSDFETQYKWINAGNIYRRFVEPLDIAYYYRNNRNGNYLSDGRPDRHKVLQKWMEAKEKTRSSRGSKPRTKRASLTPDSCFWAHVEEAWKDLENLEQGQGQHQSLQNLEKFEQYVTRMVNDLSISGDVFLEGSSFMEWLNAWKEYKKNQSAEWSSTIDEKLEEWKEYGRMKSLDEKLEGLGSQIPEWSSESESYSASKFDRIGRYTVGQETATFPPSGPKASEESCLAINSECFSHSVGLETATFLASCGILSKAWEESCLAINSESYSLNEYEGVAYVAFPSFHKIEHYNVKGSKYGEGNLQTDNNVFSGCFKGNNDQPAFVHQGALKSLLHIMENTDFQAKLQIYTDSEQKRLKPIIFVGHSLGGAVATLATLWVLEKRQSSPFCITFGSPLVGDVRLLEAVGRENWEGNFCHVVSKNDIVPRMLLAPFESTAEPLNVLLPYWWGKITNARNDQPDSFIQHAYQTLHQSVMNSATSPYKPLGTYMFCSSHGAACISSSETVLEMLRLTMQSQEAFSDKIVQDYLLEHIRYGSVLGEIIENSIRGARILNSEPYEMGISLQLEAIGVGAQNDHARIALQEAENIENKHNTNVAQLAVELSQQQCSMAQLEWYKERCEKEDIFYYDSFKIYMDTDAASPRKRLARFWNDIIEKWERQELPSNFPSRIEWINAGTAYRRLVEPLDIAHYYRTSNDGDSYLSKGRPSRHKVLQKWMEEKEKAGSTLIKLPSLSRDSCFCAHLEEALKDFESLKQGQYQRLQSLEMFENYVTKMIDEGSISSDVIARIKADSNSIPSSSEQPPPLQVLSIKVSPSTIS